MRNLRLNVAKVTARGEIGAIFPAELVGEEGLCEQCGARATPLSLSYAASGTALALASARLARASIVRSAWSALGESRMRSGVSAYSFLKRPPYPSNRRSYAVFAAPSACAERLLGVTTADNRGVAT